MSCSCSRSWTQLAICLALVALCCPAALAEETATATATAAVAAAPKDDDLGGPVVRASIDRVKDALSKANLTGDGAEKKKTIAQIIDEALEQEFPEEKPESIGKNYNETAKQEDATVETVIKVSGNKPKETKEEKEAKEREALEAEKAEEEAKDAEEAARAAEEAEKEEKSHSHLPWGLGKSKADKEKEKAREEQKEKDRQKALAKKNAPAPAKAKPRERRTVESNVEQEVDRIIDSQDNVYVLSKPKDSQMGLTLDPQLVRDLTVLITSSTAGGMILEALRQPVINGYFLAGSVVGPGGFKLIKELVQVESLAQMGVQLLLFALGLEFSLNKLRAVRSVALLGGVLEIFLFILVAGLLAHVIGASVHEGIFVGALVSMSSTSIVVKCLTDAKATNSPHGQITIGTLILQDCMVGLLFAFMPVLANKRTEEAADSLEVLRLLTRVTASIGAMVAVSMLIARTVLPPAMRILAKYASAELYQLTIIAFCLVCGWLTGYLGLSTELGAFVAGVMLSATDQQEHALSQLEHVKHFFLSLFIASTGLVMSPGFLMQHLKILAGGVVLTILGKSILISLVVWLFKFPVRTALAVGLSMAQIGEFAFVLLSVASQLGMLPYQVYMLLMGITALSLLLTPFLLQASSRILQDPGDLNLIQTAKAKKLRRSVSSGIEDEPLVGQPGTPPHSAMEMGLRGAHYDHRGSRAPSASASAFPSESSLNQRVPFL